MKDLNKLNTFVRVAERRSFTKAAQDLHMTPSAVSKHIRDLEDNLGCALLNRSTRGVALTEFGESFFTDCAEILGKLDAVVISAREARSGPSGTLRVHAAAGYARSILAPLVPSFVRRYPQLRVELNTANSPVNPVEAGFNVIVASKTPPEPGLTYQKLGVIEHVICAAPAYFRENGTPKRPQDLVQHNCLVNSLFAPKEWAFKGPGRDVTIGVTGSICSNSSAILIQAALEGIGIVRVPRYTVRAELASGRLQPIFDGIARSGEHMKAFYSRTEHLPAKTAVFIEFVRKALAPESR